MLKPIQALMVQGTTSDAGKSVLVAGLCKVLSRRGVNVAPFKSQNMALNSAVTKDGGEIGRAQALQAFACGIEPSVHMNPILLKPNTDMKAQVIVQGKALPQQATLGNSTYKEYTMPYVLDSFAQLQAQYDCIMIEGAGSPAEINLRENDIANMGFAEEANVPVIIVADIDRGGVFAHLYGTLALLSQSEQDRVIGFVINRFRGDIELLKPGLTWLEAKTGKPVIGVLPYLHDLQLDAEDAVDGQQNRNEQVKFTVFVPVLPRMSNHTDFDALRAHPEIDFQYRYQGQSLAGADLIIVPGSKSVRADLDFLRQQHWEQDIQRHLRYGGKVMGICGGYQMLGYSISDPNGIESEAGHSPGLGLLNIQTEITTQKALTQVIGRMSLIPDQSVDIKGYEIHAGVSLVEELQPIQLQTQVAPHREDSAPIHAGELLAEGALSSDGQVFGTYCHGIFDQPAAFEHILHWAGLEEIAPTQSREQQQNQSLERLADVIESELNLQLLWPQLYSSKS
ncbi:cobyric acid synthase [Vibrio gangliei]|uniref:cobyric acid synthase n=1 Tax=Vibrio gangliei TaxID=2077090 RepID=UPI00147631FB|nr:cobyric acid synthase [Vibrio gangliei]